MFRSRATCAPLLAVPLLLMAVQVAQGQQRRAVTIGFVTDGPFERIADITELIQSEIRDLLSAEFDVRMPAEKFYRGDWTVSGIDAYLDSLLADPEVDLVVTLGAFASHIGSGRRDLSKPVVTPFIINADLQGLPRTGAGSGVQNLTYLALPENRDLETFRDMVPFTRVAVLINGPLAEAIPGLADRFTAASAELGIEPVVVPVGLNLEAALAQLDAADVEAVYVLPQLQLNQTEWEQLIQALIDRRLPSFSWWGRREVVEGIMTGSRPDRFIPRVARRIALNIQRILLGEDPSTLQVAFQPQERLVINMATARAISVYPSFKVLTEAELIAEEERRAERQLTLERAVAEAIQANLDLATADRSVAAGAQDVRLAKSFLWPQIDIGADWRMIDEVRAESSFGRAAEREVSGVAGLEWTLINDPVWANVSIQGSVQESRVQDRETLRLDIARGGAVTYLNVLKAKTFERIERENLSVTRENLELSEIRESIGTANPGEVYRWESQIANNRQAVIDAITQRNLVEIELNRLLDRPLEERFETAEADLSDTTLVTSQDELYPYLDNLASFRLFRQFMAQEALEASPELQALDALARAERRNLKSTSRAFWLPTISAFADLGYRFTAQGAGSEPPSDIPFQGRDDLVWSFGFVASYPLFTGAGRLADNSQAAERVAEIETGRDALAQRVEQRMRSALHEMRASLADIDLSRAAAEASLNNFELVQDSYSRGRASIVELLDAQNAALVAGLQASTAVYDFLIDLMNVERAANRFDFFLSEADWAAFFERLDAYFQAAGMAVRR